MSPYEILQLKPGASLAEIQQAYRDLVRVWHPDRFANDTRLQKIAEEKLRQINQAYFALQNTPQSPREEPPPRETTQGWESARRTANENAREAARDTPAAPHGWRKPAKPRYSLIPAAMLLLSTIVLLSGIAFVYSRFTAPLNAFAMIGGDARRMASLHGPNLTDALQGWNGALPQGLAPLLRFYRSAPPAGASWRGDETPAEPARPRRVRAIANRAASGALPRSGIGEILVHNQTDEAAHVVLTAKNNSGSRRFTIAPRAEALFGDLGPAVYTVDVVFPNSRTPAMRVGPFVMIETETASQKEGDRYEINLRPPAP